MKILFDSVGKLCDILMNFFSEVRAIIYQYTAFYTHVQTNTHAHTTLSIHVNTLVHNNAYANLPFTVN